MLSKITAKILLGLRYLHKERHTIHRDIKPANILINLLVRGSGEMGGKGECGEDGELGCKGDAPFTETSSLPMF